MAVSKLKKEIKYIQQHDEFDYLRCLIESLEKGRCIGILLHGPPGTGKTLLAITLAKEMSSSYYFIDGSPDVDRRDLEGNWELIEGMTKFNYGPLTMAIKDANEKGIAFIIINEINAIRESEQISLNSLLSENHINLISKGFERHELNPDSKLIIIGTMNKGVVGINKLQESFEDRFIVCPEINYPDKNKEIDITKQVSNCEKDLAELVVDAARQIRKQATEDFSITKIFSTRLIVNFCSVITKMPPKFIQNSIKNVIINKLGETMEERKSIAMILDGKMFERKLKTILNHKKEEKKISKEEKPIIEQIKEMTHERCLQVLRDTIKHYREENGEDSIFRENGEIMWKFLEHLYKKKQVAFKKYMMFTEKVNLPDTYKRATGKAHMYQGELTLSYIKWLYRNKNKHLVHFLRNKIPIL